MNLLIIVDNLLIGGIQRLALDQAYKISESKNTCTILVLNKKTTFKKGTFLFSEAHILNQKKIKVQYVPGSRIMQAIQIIKLFRSETYDKVIAHSLRGGLIAFVCRPLTFRKFSISTTIHQLPSFSKKTQRLKRMFYSQFTDRLFIFSSAALNNWNSERNKSFLARVLTIRRAPELCRNGVYLPRLVNRQSRTRSSRKPTRLIFIGRLTEWKGFNYFLDLIKLEELIALDILIIVPTDPSTYLKNLPEKIRKKVKFTIGKSVSEIKFKSGDIHIYPVINSSGYVESISINVLEMASLGIPSLVTMNGSDTWPELIRKRLVIEVDWSNLKAVSKVISKLKLKDSSDQLLKTRKILDVENNLNQIIK